VRNRFNAGPVIIIGAARSGTNMLRNVLCSFRGFGTWPCDEINYIWRHGNAHYPNDEFPPDLASPKVTSYIRRRFKSIADRYSLQVVVEKTCANSLRVGFVDRVVPAARFIFLLRDGRDAVASAIKRWTAPLDMFYLLKKARFVPLIDVPYYASRYFVNRFQKVFSKEKGLSFWGPRLAGMDLMVGSKSLLEVCAIQWARCVEKSLDQMRDIDPSRIHRIKYEEFVTNPQWQLQELTKFLGIYLSPDEVKNSIQDVTPKSVGNWEKDFADGDLEVLETLIRTPMKRLGYI
jgi:hypothetical protein